MTSEVPENESKSDLQSNEGPHAASPKIKQPPVLFDKTQGKIKKIESILGGRLITYWNNPRGSICHNDVLALYDLLESIGPQETIYLFLKSDGGNGQASLRFVNLIRQNCERLITLIPLECASAATMIAIGSNQIQMGPLAYLTAVDTSLTHDLSPIDRDNARVSVSLDELNRVVKLWRSTKTSEQTNPYNSLFDHVHPLVIGAVDRAESLSIKICRDLLSYHVKTDEQALEIANILNSRYPSHSFPILEKEARAIGLNVGKLAGEVNSLLLDLNELYSEMGQKATTDFDQTRSHGNEIINILEAMDSQLFYQQDKDWFYRESERRWITMNDNSGWRKVGLVDGEIRQTVMHIS